jgi:sucrose-6F-phosphate phosphohydrolase
LATGRRYDQVLSGLADEGLPQPDAIIAQVGSEIYLPPFHEAAQPMAAWDALLSADFDRAEAEAFCSDVPGLQAQPEYFCSALKFSAYLDACDEPAAVAELIHNRVREHNAAYRVVFSSGKDLDILPARAGKGKALQFLVDHWGCGFGPLVAAGDTGNDLDLFVECDHGIAVANAQVELKEWVGAAGAERAVVAGGRSAAGVHEGLRALGLLPA